MTSSRRMMRIAVAFAAVIGFGAVDAWPSTAAAAPPQDLRITRFLGEQRLPHKMEFGGTVVGGLSGLDRDPLTGTWYLISDDRWRYNPARFYTGRLDINPVTGKFTGVRRWARGFPHRSWWWAWCSWAVLRCSHHRVSSERQSGQTPQ